MLLLTADIGGTYSRFGLFETGPLRLARSVSLSSAVPDFAALLDSLAAAWPDVAPTEPDRLALAVAGPVLSPLRVRPTNIPYAIDLAEMMTKRPLPPALLMNDFVAQAWACLGPALGEAEPLSPCARPPFRFPSGESRGPAGPACVTLLGAGTGLGMARLLIKPGAPALALASEGGQAAFPLRCGDELERDFARLLGANGRPYPRRDDVLSGSGLRLLHGLLCGGDADPAVFTAEPGFAASAICEAFARFYGRACRDAALETLPDALVLSGGMAAKTPALVRHPAFRAEFLNAEGQHREFLEELPLWRNVNPWAALWGAAEALLREGEGQG